MLRDFSVRPVNFNLDAPQPRHATNALDMYRAGVTDRIDQDQGFLRQQVGGALASGASPLEAANIAFAGGDLQAGFDLQSLPREKLVGLMEWLPKAAQGADTPDKWAMLMERARPIFGEDLDPYIDFSSRSALISDAEEMVTSIKDVDGQPSIVSYPKSDPSDFTVTPLGSGGPATSNPSAPYKDPKQKADVEAGVRKEFTSASQDFRDVRDAHRRVIASASDPSAAGDLALIFNYMKILDPGSTVREGEFANAQNSGGVPARARGIYNSILNGKRLSKGVRDDFVDRAKRLYDAQKNQHAQLYRDFEARAKRLNLSVENVLPDFSSAGTELSEASDDEVLGVLDQ